MPDSAEPAGLEAAEADAELPDATLPSDDAEVAWYASLPTLFGAAAALFTNPDGRVLLVKPNYREHWSLPGGILEHGEAPHAGCRREVAEEIGLDITPGPLLVVGWAAPEGLRPRPIVHFVFDGGEIRDDTPIRLQAEELDAYRFTAAGDLDRYLPPVLSARVAAGLRSRGTGSTTYLPWVSP